MKLKLRQRLRLGVWFFLVNSLLSIIIGFRYFSFISFQADWISVLYMTFAMISHFVLLSMIPYLVLYIPFAFIVKRSQILKIWLIIIATISIFILILDTYVFALYRFHINMFTLEMVFGGAADQVFAFNFVIYLFGLLIISGVVIVEWLISLFALKWILRRQFKLKLIFIPVTIFFILSQFLHIWADAVMYKPITSASRVFPLYFPFTAKSMMNKIGIGSNDIVHVDMEEVNNKEGQGLNYPKHRIVLPEISNKKNIIWILLDAWHYKSLDSIVSPNIYKFSKKCSVFLNHSSGSNGTRTGIFSLFYSIPGIFWYDVASLNESPVWIDVLLEEGYSINAFPGASLENPPFDKTVFVKTPNVNLNTKGKEVWQRDIQLTHDWKDFVDSYLKQSPDTPFFSFLFYDALHGFSVPPNSSKPFQPSWDYAKYHLLTKDTDPTEFKNLYKNCLFFVDSLVGSVLDDLEEKGILENTVVMITGDHGQEFNDNKKNYWGHNGNYSKAQLNVPLLLYGLFPDCKKSYYWTTHYDIVPTFMNRLFKCENPVDDYSVGRFLNDSMDRKGILVGSKDNFGMVEKDRITNVNFNGSFDIYDSTMTPLPDAKINHHLFKKLLDQANQFYDR